MGEQTCAELQRGDVPTETHDLLLVDLDGVVWLQGEPIPQAAAALDAARGSGIAVCFVTNNASSTPEVIAERLRAVGVKAGPDEVETSAMAAATVLAERLAAGSRVLVVGGEGLRSALRAHGLRPVTRADEDPVAVVQGWSHEIAWPLLAEAAVALGDGLPWLATNLDSTMPSARGPLPGNGAMVAALVTATGRHPDSVGKPRPEALRLEAAARAGQRPLMVGDRLDTDIAGAVAVGFDSLLVLTGVTSPADVVTAAGSERPTYLGRDLAALSMTHPRATVSAAGQAHCGAAAATRRDGTIVVEGSAGTDGLDGLRALAALCWSSDLPPEVGRSAAHSLDLDLR